MKHWVCCIIVFVSGAAAGMLLPRFCPFLCVRGGGRDAPAPFLPVSVP